uniref:Nudix hydrolase domain-containing protein n=2 Tax=Strongyloides stercoralis TaxID=6248 RepID=A0A0K0E2P4_STRER
MKSPYSNTFTIITNYIYKNPIEACNYYNKLISHQILPYIDNKEYMYAAFKVFSKCMNENQIIEWLKFQYFKTNKIYFPLSIEEMDIAQEAFWFFQENIKTNYIFYKNVRNFQEFLKLILNIEKNNCNINYSIRRMIINHRIHTINIPRYGCILLNSSLNSILMVKSAESVGTWNLPKGKIKSNEYPHECAIRETYEETGFYCFDVTYKLFIDAKIGKKYFGYFIVLNVPMNYKFMTRSPYEINDIQWVLIKDILKCIRPNMERTFERNPLNKPLKREPKFRQVFPIIQKLLVVIDNLKEMKEF